MEPDAETEHRKLFHNTRGGGIDLARLVEQLIPAILMGALVIYANLQVTRAQVDDVRQEVRELKGSYYVQNDKLIALNAQVAAYLGQQTQLNAAMDARLTYIERGQRPR